MEKFKAIETATKRIEAGINQYWIKSARGGSWQLWDETELLRCIKVIPAKRVFWIIPY